MKQVTLIGVGQIGASIGLGLKTEHGKKYRVVGYDPDQDRSYIMYLLSGGGYGGNADADGISNGCSTIGISKTQPVEIVEQRYPVLFEEYSLH